MNGKEPEWNESLDFTTPPKVRATDPETSRRAWEHVMKKIGTQRYRILCTLDVMAWEFNPKGMTQDEISDHSQIRVNSVSTRISELLRQGYLEVVPGVERQGQRVVRRIK